MLLEDARDNDEGQNGFPPSARTATQNENRTRPGVFIMESCPNPSSKAKDYREILVPLIGLRALTHVLYKNLVRLILEANYGMAISYAHMQLLWDAIVHKAYHFVCACKREAKGKEVCIGHRELAG